MDTIGFQTGQGAPGVIPEELFGGNFIFTSDDPGGTYAGAAATLGLSVLRYPGGSVTEAYFDLNDPDNPQQGGVPVAPISEFLDLCAALGARPCIVLPTIRYAGRLDAGRAEVARFMDRLVSGEWGETDGLMIEIGNEYAWPSEAYGVDPVTAEAYGAIASALAVEVHRAGGAAVQISVQAGVTTADNATIMGFFDTAAEREAVDAVSIHAYPWRFETVVNAYWTKGNLARPWEDAGIAEEVFLSEWNIRSEADYDPALMDYGLPQAAAMVEQVAMMAKWGVDLATSWAVQNNNRTSLATREGQGQLRIGGETFLMMRETLAGTRLAEDRDISTGAGLFALHRFEDAGKTVIFLSARDLSGGDARVALDLSGLGDSGLGGGFRLGFVKTLTAEGDTESPQARPVTSVAMIGSADLDRGRITLDFTQEGEVKRIVLVRDGGGSSPLRIEGDGQANDLDGGFARDVISGNAGSDVLVGLGGGDLLDGGDGNDRLSGMRGRDTLEGGSGDDFLFGGDAADSLSGGRGADQLYGGRGADLLDGGAGQDRLKGGTGSDSFVIDVADAGPDLVLDARASDGDRIVLEGFSGSLPGLRLVAAPMPGGLDGPDAPEGWWLSGAGGTRLAWLARAEGETGVMIRSGAMEVMLDYG
jgi:hypothetical protein